mmetsp:Transcript_58654/g.138130  ORF Transcript_58654/g.138130 Transcript_58654/m.138130 type:complete len:167 (-) Transcript_58654:148-648(-)
MLNPDCPPAVNKIEHYKKKFGLSTERLTQMTQRMKSVGEEEGIHFSYGGDLGNSFDAHRLVWLGQQQGKEDATMSALFAAYFEQEKNPADHSVLLAAGATAGLTGVQEMLSSSQGASEVKGELATKARGVSGVPHFIVDDTYEISGAQEAPVFVQLFKRLAATRPG